MVLAVCISSVAIYMKSRNDKKMLAELKVERDRMTQNIAKRNILEDEIALKWDEYNENTADGMCYIVLFVENISKNLTSDAYPTITTKSGYGATAVMSNFDAPGDEGCISIDEFIMLRDAGWDFAIGQGDLTLPATGWEKVLSDYIDEYEEKLAKQGIDLPVTFCFNDNEYDEKYDDLLWEKGFKVVRHFGENGEMYSKSAAEGRIYHLASGRICTGYSNVKDKISEANNYNYSYSVSVRYIRQNSQDDSLDCTHTKYETMLNYIDGLSVVPASKLYDKKIEALAHSGEYVEKFNAEIAEAEKRLEELNKEIADITA